MKNQFFTIMVCLLMCTLGVNGQKKQAAGVIITDQTGFVKGFCQFFIKTGSGFCILLSGR
mgnify:CR=1 FL=1